MNTKELLQRIVALHESISGNAYGITPTYCDTWHSKLQRLRMDAFGAEKRGDVAKTSSLGALIAEIEEYLRLCGAFVKKKSTDDEISSEELYYIVLFLKEIAEDTTCEKELFLPEFENILQSCLDSSLTDSLDEAIYLSLLIEAYGHDRRYWRARRHAQRLDAVLSELSDGVRKEYYKLVCEQYETLSSFYRRVRDVRKAAAFMRLGADAALGAGDAELSATMLRRAITYEQILPEVLRTPVHESELRGLYGALADDILKPTRYLGIKVDPVEHTDAFLAVFDEVMEAVEDTLTAEQRTLPFYSWSLMRQELAKRGIKWSDPSAMNPGVMFD